MALLPKRTYSLCERVAASIFIIFVRLHAVHEHTYQNRATYIIVVHKWIKSVTPDDINRKEIALSKIAWVERSWVLELNRDWLADVLNAWRRLYLRCHEALNCLFMTLQISVVLDFWIYGFLACWNSGLIDFRIYWFIDFSIIWFLDFQIFDFGKYWFSLCIVFVFMHF